MALPRKVTKLLNIYGLPIYLLAIVVELTLAVLWIYFSFSGKIEETITLGIQAILTLLTVFAGIFIPLLIQRRQKAQDDRREMGYGLTLIWQELRTNRHRLEQIKINFSFRLLMEIANFREMISLLRSKYETVYDQTRDILSNAFMAAQQSGLITKIDKDETLNSILQAYENLEILKSNALIVNEDIFLKFNLANQNIDPISPQEEVILRESCKQGLIGVNKALDYGIQQVDKAITEIDNRLNNLGIKAELEERNLPDILELP